MASDRCAFYSAGTTPTGEISEQPESVARVDRRRDISRRSGAAAPLSRTDLEEGKMSYSPILLLHIASGTWECCLDLSQCFSAKVPAGMASLETYLSYQ